VGFPDAFVFIGNGYLGIFPMAFLIFAAAVAVFAIILNKTRFGRGVFMLGANPVAARFSGLNIPSIQTKVYIMNGLLAGVSAMIMISRSNSAKSGYGSSYLLQSILIVLLGGTNPAGGFGSILGVIMAIFIVQFLGSGFNILGFSPFVQDVIRGTILLLVMVINFYSGRRAQRIKTSAPEPTHE
jgi:simple sugar transport system permease protein